MRRVLVEHDQRLRERAELVDLLDRLTPAWAELRALLNELAARVDPTR